MLKGVGPHRDFCRDVTTAGGCLVLANYYRTERTRNGYLHTLLLLFRV
jgi:hypothetical protein